MIQRHIRPEKRWEFEGAIRKPQNFLTHADKDPDAVLDFEPHATELLLLLDTETYRELARDNACDERIPHLRSCDMGFLSVYSPNSVSRSRLPRTTRAISTSLPSSRYRTT